MVRQPRSPRLLRKPVVQLGLAALGVAAMGALLAAAQAPAPAKISPKVPAAAVVAAAPAPASAPEQSLLGGAWKVNWVRLGKVTPLTISAEQPQPGILGFQGVLTDLAGAECKGGGFAARSLGGVFPAGGEVSMIGVADYLRVVTNCGTSQVWLEAFGVAGQPLQWIGRAMMVDDKGQRKFESFIATR